MNDGLHRKMNDCLCVLVIKDIKTLQFHYKGIRSNMVVSQVVHITIESDF